jgi:hypothetical protein
MGVKYGGRKDGPWIFHYMYLLAAAYHEGNTEEDNNGYVVFKWTIHGSAGKLGGGEWGRRCSVHPQLFILYSKFLDRYLKTT